MRHAAPRLALPLALAASLFAASAHAETLQAPAGGRSIRFETARVACPDALANRGWTVDPDGRGVRPPAAPDPSGQPATLTVAPDAASCAGATTSVTLVTLGAPPAVERGSVVFDSDAGTVTVRGHGLRDAVLHWTDGAHTGDDRCSEPQTAGGAESCTFAVTRGLGAEASGLSLWFLPPGSRTAQDVSTYDAQGHRVDPVADVVHPSRVLVARVLPDNVSVDVQSGEARVPFVHPEAVASVDCDGATCDLDGNDLVIRDARTAGDALELHVRLRPHAAVAHGSSLDTVLNSTIPLQRCPVAIASAPPLRGVHDQRLVVRVGGACARDASLNYALTGSDALLERTETAGDASYAVLRVSRVEGGEVAVTVSHGGTVVGVARARTRQPPPLRARIELEGQGVVDFVPTNRDAVVLLPAGEGSAQWVPVPVEGVYTVRRDDRGRDVIRGVDGVAGSVALRAAYRDRSLPASLRETDLAVLPEPTDRAIRVANIPVPLAGPAGANRPLIELLCGDGTGRVRPMASGITESVPYRSRDTCRLVLHRERLRPEDGAQSVHLSVEIVGSDGSPHSDAHLDQRITLQPGPQPRLSYITGVSAPFDRVIVRASLASDDTHYAVAPDENAGAPQMQWSVVFGNDRFRIYATTAIPTGLFRVSNEHSGILTLNAGAILRAVLLSREGHESPIGLEAGVMWVGIAGDTGTGASALGQVAVVAGLGVGVPIANASHASQTSINLHLWAEYEVSRQFSGGGNPWGLVFGPSISIGDIGANF